MSVLHRLMRDRRARADDQGVYAILFAILIVTLVGVAALVLDLALVRESRAATRSAVDSAVVAGATELNELVVADSDPRAACQTVWTYLRDGLDDLDDGSASCTGFETTYATCPAAPIVADWSGGGYRVRITWPVLDTSPLMTNPDTAPAAPSQGIDTVVDGTNPCSRLGVEVFRDNRLALGGVFGIGESTTRAASVARSIVNGSVQSVIAALNILEQTGCDALITSGQGGITVGTIARPGVIAVESSGTRPGNNSPGCANSNAATIKPLTNPNNFIRAVGTGSSIQAFALNPAPTGNPPKSYFLYPGTNANLTPTPVQLAVRVGDSPVRDFYDCTSNCQSGGGDYIASLVSQLGGPGVPAGYTVLSDATFPGFRCNQNASTPDLVLPAGNYYVDCATWSISKTVVFAGGNVVTRGAINLGSQDACLAVNVPSSTATCPTLQPASGTSPVTTNPSPSTDSVLFIRTGRLYKVAQASFFAPQTMTYLGNGYTELLGGSGTLVMTSPRATACSTDACRFASFYKLTLWSTSSQTHSIGGQSNLGLRGVLFTPNATSVFTGQAGSNQTSAQFWTRTLEIGGQGTLVMDVDPDAAIARPSLGAALIR